MTINVEIKKDGNEKVKTIDIPMDKVVKGLTHLSVFSFVGREVNRVRPPKRNIGLVANWMAALCVTDAIMRVVFPESKEEKKEDSVVDCESYSEVKSDDTEGKEDSGEV